MKRNNGIDCLRLVLMYMISVLHILEQGGIINSARMVGSGYEIYCFMEAMTCCSVNSFVFISGYLSNPRKKQNTEKIINMWFQVFFYSFVLTIILSFFNSGIDLEIIDIVKATFPIIFKKYWYFVAYVALFCAQPLLNQYLAAVEEKSARIHFIVIVTLYSGIGFLTDSFETNWGYSAIWLMVVYILGGLSNRIKLFEKKKIRILITLYLICVIVSWTGKVYFGIDRFLGYNSPTMLFAGIILVLLFSRMNLNIQIIQKLYPLAFGIYLFQLNQIIYRELENAFKFIPNLNIGIGIIYVLGMAFGICLIGMMIEFIRMKIFIAIRVPKLSRKVNELGTKIVVRLSTYL